MSQTAITRTSEKSSIRLLRKLSVFLLLGVFVASSSGCFLAPAIDSFNKLGVTSSDRQALLAERIKLFSDALYWGEPSEAMLFVAPAHRVTLEPEFRRIKKQEKIVENKIESVEFSEDARKAKVEMTVRSYKVPFYVVNDRTEIQNWEFNLSDGWLLASRAESKRG